MVVDPPLLPQAHMDIRDLHYLPQGHPREGEETHTMQMNSAGEKPRRGLRWCCFSCVRL